jgi:hypothetical protein
VRRTSKAPSAIANAGRGTTPVGKTLFGMVCVCVAGLAAFLGMGSGAPAAGAADACPNEALRIEMKSTFLPECRAYEMVSPPEKNGGGVLLNPARTRAATDGSAFSFASLSGFGDIVGSGISNDYMAVRGSERWASHAIQPPQDPQTVLTLAQGMDPIYLGNFSSDLSTGVVRVNPSQTPLTPDSTSVQKVQNLYLRTNLHTAGPGSYELLTSCQLCLSTNEPLATSNGYKPTFADASSDFSHIAFISAKNLTEDTASLSEADIKLYEWLDGDVRLAGRIPVSGIACDDEGGPACEPAPRSAGGQPAVTYDMSFTMSPNGSRVLFTTPSGQELSDLYLRENGTSTIKINASERTTPDASELARAWAASDDLSKIFFTSSERLTDSAEEGGCRTLYMYDASKPSSAPDNLTLISADSEPGDGTCHQVRGAIGASADGSYVYFIADGQLEAGGPLAPGFTVNIFVWHDGVVRYVGELADDAGEATLIQQEVIGTNPDLIPETSRVAPDGKNLTFVSLGSSGLVGYDHGSCPNSIGICREIYHYDAEANGGAGELACVSCNPSGAPATADAVISFRDLVGGANSTTHTPHYLSNDGRYVFFSTAERLVKDDVNGKIDAYVYDTKTDEPGLLSTGGDGDVSYFMDASADGQDAFIATRERLSGWDFDGAYDVYDVRIGGGLPEPPPPDQLCEGDACQPPPGDLNDPTPSSSSFAGSGNQAAARKRGGRCPQGARKVKARGKTRCVKRQNSGNSRAKANRGESR